eukprot:8532014-Alexandrium_andersonii.AAC.1
MSASLVGSEMCIRDRTGHACAGRASRPQAVPSPALGKKQRKESARNAVSYTHLTLPTICSV